MILFFNYTVQYFDFTEKRRKPSASPSVTKNGRVQVAIKKMRWKLLIWMKIHVLSNKEE